MPISPENRKRYPKNWKEISFRIRFVRAKGQCEMLIKNGADIEEYRCNARHGKPHPITGSKVVLTTMHLDHTPENCDELNLLAACQRCHLKYDAQHHAQSRIKNKKCKQTGELL